MSVSADQMRASLRSLSDLNLGDDSHVVGRSGSFIQARNQAPRIPQAHGLAANQSMAGPPRSAIIQGPRIALARNPISAFKKTNLDKANLAKGIAKTVSDTAKWSGAGLKASGGVFGKDAPAVLAKGAEHLGAMQGALGGTLTVADGIMSAVKFGEASREVRNSRENMERYQNHAKNYQDAYKEYMTVKEKMEDPNFRGDKLQLVAKMRRLRQELSGNALGAQRHSEAKANLDKAQDEKTRAGWALAGACANLPKAVLDVSKASALVVGKSLPAAVTGTVGNMVATGLSGVSGGVGIVTGGITLGYEIYNHHKASTKEEQAKKAFEAQKGLSKRDEVGGGDKIRKNIAKQSIERSGQAKSTAKKGILGGVLSIVGGILAITALALTGVGALVLAGTALACGVTAGILAIKGAINKYSQAKSDQALKDQVKNPERLGAALAEAREKAIAKYGDRQPPLTEPQKGQRAEFQLARENPFYAVKLMTIKLATGDAIDQDHARRFMRSAGIDDPAIERINLLAKSRNDDEKAAAQTALEKHFGIG